MIRSAVTVCLAPEARGGPFVFWDDLPRACRKARELGFDGVELFPPSAGAIDADDLHGLLGEHGLRLAAVGTGAGRLLHGLHLCDGDARRRRRAVDFIRSIIDLAARFDAPAIIGSMQGRHGDGVERRAAMAHLADALDELGAHAASHGVSLLYEPLNRYETNLVNTLAAGVELLETLRTGNVKLLADLFHMNIEEQDLGDALRTAADVLGHVHFVDSNRRPAGCGHLDYHPIAEALHEIGFDGFASAEALPYPSPDDAARQTIEALRLYLGR